MAKHRTGHSYWQITTSEMVHKPFTEILSCDGSLTMYYIEFDNRALWAQFSSKFFKSLFLNYYN